MGIKVPIKPNVGPILVTISVFSNIFSILFSSLSINFLVNASWVLLFNELADKISIKIFFCYLGKIELLIVFFTDFTSVDVEIEKIKSLISETGIFFLLINSDIKPPSVIIA